MIPGHIHTANKAMWEGEFDWFKLSLLSVSGHIAFCSAHNAFGFANIVLFVAKWHPKVLKGIAFISKNECVPQLCKT